MGLPAGHKLSHYEIVDLIGKGGMGEVYRAHDTQLGREAAIKVLPAAVVRELMKIEFAGRADSW